MNPSYLTTSILCVCLLCGADRASAEVFTFDSPPEWETWTMPRDIIKFGTDGSLGLRQFRKDTNAVLDAGFFSQPTQTRGEVTGGVWQAGSNPLMALRIMDGDPATHWSPNPADELVDWVATIDLGRPVLAERIRLIFPDREGARPLRQFSVFTANGARIQATDDVFKYDQAFQTTKPNYDAVIDIELVGERDTTRVVDESLGLQQGPFNTFRMVRFIRIRADAKSADAALAEVEVIAAGDNLSLGVLGRGGAFDNGLLAREPQNMFDGITDTYGNIFTVKSKGGWRESGVWWEVDLGALFWIDEAFIYWQHRGEGQSSFLFEGLQAGSGYEVLFSDGRRTISGDIDYTPLIFEPRPTNGREWNLRHHRYIFAPRKIRYLFWHSLTDTGWFSHPMEFMLFSPGYPAQVELRSDFIDLGQIAGDGRPKAIKSLNWEATTPTGTRLQLRSRSGNELQEIYAFYDKKGEEVTETRYNSLPKVLKGPIDTTVVAGADWGEWSNFYQFAGEAFKSATPRRFVQLELIISTDDPQAAPRVGSLAIEFEDALVQGARGRIAPRSAAANEETRFTYTIWSRSDLRDSGFDRLRFTTPSDIDPESVRLWIGAEPSDPEAVRLEGDSLLFVDLPAVVLADSVQVEFTTRVLRNATIFTADLGQEERPGLWQSVEAVQRQANMVFLPDLVATNRLIGDLEVLPRAFSPNGDGINDRLQIRFALFKAVAAAPQVHIRDLSGRIVAVLRQGGDGEDIKHFSWSGVDARGKVVPPGIYLCHIDAGAESGRGVAIRTIAVAY